MLPSLLRRTLRPTATAIQNTLITSISPITSTTYASHFSAQFSQLSRQFSDVTIVPWDDAKDEMPIVRATRRGEKERGEKWANNTRRGSNYKQIPATLSTKEFRDGHKNTALEMPIVVDPTNLSKVLKQGNLYNTVFNLEIEGEPEPIRAIVTNYDTDLVTYKPLCYHFFRYIPGRKWNVKLPVKFENEEDSVVVKKGGFLLSAAMYAPCRWRGDHKIPRFVKIDVLNTRVGRVYKLDPEKDMTIPNLTMRHPERGKLVLASCVGGRGAKDVDDEEAA